MKKFEKIIENIWFLYLFLCFSLSISIAASIFDGDYIYIKSMSVMRGWIIFFTPCIINLVYRKFKSFTYFEKCKELNSRCLYLIDEIEDRDKQWEGISSDLFDLDFDSEDLKASEIRKEISKLNEKIGKIEEKRKKSHPFGATKRLINYPGGVRQANRSPLT